jgi:hypothetical protein
MSWTKDSVSEAPKVVYTPGPEGPIGCTKLVYDPNAPAEQRLTAYFSHLTVVNETLQQIETALGL